MTLQPAASRRLLAAILLLAALLRVAGINSGFPDINRYFWESDEGGIVQTIMGFGTGDLNPHAFSQPTFFLYLVFGLYGLLYVVGRMLGWFGSPADFAYFYFVNPAPFYVIGRGVSVLAGMLTVWLVYRLGVRLFGSATGLLAAFFLAIAGLHVEASHIMKTDATSVLFVVAAIIWSVEIVETGSWRASWLAGLCAGLAAGTRYPSGAVLLCVVAAHGIALARARRSWRSWILERRLWASGAAAIAAFVAVAPFTLLDWSTFSAQLRYLASSVAGGGDPLRLGYQPNFWVLHWVQLAEPSVLGPIFVGLIGLGVIVSVRRHRWQDVLLWPVPAFLYWLYSDNSTFTRTIVPALYLLPAVPVLLLLAARAITGLADQAGRAQLAIIGGVLLLVMPHAVRTAARSIQLSQPSTEVRARAWLEAHVPAGSRILIDRAQIPQLSFTPGSLERRRATQVKAYGTALGASRRTALDADVGAADALRTKSLTEVGVPYDLFILLDTSEEPLPDELDFFRRGLQWTVSTYGIQYVVLSSHIYGTFLEDPYDDIASEHRRYREFAESLSPTPTAWTIRRKFYADVEATCELVMDIRPDPLRSAGPRIKIYRVPSGLRE